MTGFITELAIAIWETLRAMSPYLIFGFLVAGLGPMFVGVRTWLDEAI